MTDRVINARTKHVLALYKLVMTGFSDLYVFRVLAL